VSTGMKDEVIRAQLKRQCCHRIPTVAGEEMTIMTLSRPIKSPWAPRWNPRAPMPSQPLPGTLCFSQSTRGSRRSFAGHHRWRAPQAPWRCPGGAPPSGDDLSEVTHQGED
jgi:hypothetical protein